MTYNFDEIISRRGTNSIKWDSVADDNVLPMWVADMDFKTPPEIINALSRKAEQGMFGYSFTPHALYDAIISWWETSHEVSLKKEWLLPVPGMIPVISAIVRTYLQPGDHIIVQSPVYNHFFLLIENCGCHAVENHLIYENGNYQIDFEDLEMKASDPQNKMLLLCSPHNPVGRVWTRQELEKIASICSRHNVMVISDEIHADIVYKENKHVPFLSVAEDYDLLSVTCGSPCKTFNLSSLPVSYVITKDQEFKKQISKILSVQETYGINPFAAEALIAAYTHGRDWMEELKEYLYNNYLFLKDFCKDHLPNITIGLLQATYLVWLDCRILGKGSEELSKLLFKEEKLWLNPGTMYGSSGEGFLRMNIACPREVLEEGLKRFEKYINKKRD
ncbi:MalY/PatB family protein [Chryseobacterium sp. PTM-20240506]|uniref:MalY/PatB family protein n=1 Tax=unclassified Chryseobacterium TaxID=2593645 RepID=UPI00235979AC|nr:MULTISPECIES: MalY/PatB family protein [unclassified Chryseobacterium]MDC8103609.1 pyridoxal phosphate-dependent aminotransferase [Chryseobacterium sp. B21-037]MDQ1803214.1 MalY/PatB family protein [Chryseobacterium sp. CKR4-1]